MVSGSKVEYLDRAFWDTMESQDYKNAKMAIKYVLFGDERGLDKRFKGEDKWLFLLNRNGGRALARKLHHVDLMHILVKFCYQYFGLCNMEFSIDEEKYQKLKEERGCLEKLTVKEVLEFVVYASFKGVSEVYVLLGIRKDLMMEIVELLIHERYFENRAGELDSFKEILHPQMSKSDYERFIMSYHSLDQEFELLKRKTLEYQSS